MSLRYLTTAQAAAVVGVSTNTMRTFIEEPGGPRTRDIGRNGRPRLRILEDDLREWMDTRERPQASAS